MLLRAIVAFLALPGLVAFVVPLAWALPRNAAVPLQPAGLAILGVGLVILGWCVRDFHVRGRGTLAPWSPPRHLVTTGLYRLSRNPMYLGVLIIVAGWAIGFRSRGLGLYALALAVLFHLRVVLGEEPWLARTHGEAWTAYVAVVPRWIGRATVHGRRKQPEEPG